MVNRIELVKKLNLSGNGIEIGVQQGKFSKKILENSNLHLYLVDAWRNQSDYNDSANVSDVSHIAKMVTTISNLLEFEGRFTLIREFSSRAATIFPNNFFSFIYIDANHSYEQVKNDIKKWFPKLKAGGTIAGHDYVRDDKIFQVKKAVDEFFGINKVKTTSERFPSWYITP